MPEVRSDCTPNCPEVFAKENSVLALDYLPLLITAWVL